MSTYPAEKSEPAVSGNMVYLNSSLLSSYSKPFTGNRDPQPNCITVYDSASSQLGENSCSSWRDGRPFMQVHGGDELVRDSDDPQIDLQAQLCVLNEQNFSFQQSLSSGQVQGLSLSLGVQIPAPFKYQRAVSAVSVLNSDLSDPRDVEIYGNENFRSTILNSKYIKAAQQLLDEIVSLQKALKQKADSTKTVNSSVMVVCKDNNGASGIDGNASEHQEHGANSLSELLPSEKQEIQNKMTKLLAMLDEVDRRYKQYFNEMQIVDSSFDAIAGSGAAKPYTSLALQTISRHFRSLRDTIGSQIRSSRKLLGEQDGSNGRGCGISSLRNIDQHIRQQKVMQQLGVMPQHAWRPQRGLPENSVSILRAWLFEHFLHPYPNDSEKLMLARQTGLTRSQISNWFINARVRLWKPMVEDIYKEEFGENNTNSNSSSEMAAIYIDELCKNAQENQQSSPNERCHTNQSSQLNQISQSNAATAAQVPGFQTEPMNQRLLTYMVNELEMYNNGGRVSLTLGLQHSDVQEGFLSSRGADEEI
ncbi:BEL1-like homeodomain protein 7 isoform X2 [Phalaenopsis equestris]|uniref:BEL1-like homeodomain protein 7 isoform X2 n=1 Tax=Phalaenopsis equestris TaxID=78828 RepID=UPI0009E57658|nr:BEL1-like homeodomain protein 7 isoform X2 [Phalaenopsis equestris]